MAMVNSKESENLPDIAPQRSSALAWSDALMATASIEQHPQRLLADIILARAESHGTDPALLSDHESFNFSDLAIRTGTYQVWANAKGLGKGDTVALMMANRWRAWSSVRSLVPHFTPGARTKNHPPAKGRPVTASMR